MSTKKNRSGGYSWEKSLGMEGGARSGGSVQGGQGGCV